MLLTELDLDESELEWVEKLDVQSQGRMGLDRIVDLLVDDGVFSPEDATDASLLRERVEEVLQMLGLRWRRVIRLRYGIGSQYMYWHEEIARLLHWDRGRVSSIHANALHMLRYPKRSDRLKPFLETLE